MEESRPSTQLEGLSSYVPGIEDYADLLRSFFRAPKPKAEERRELKKVLEAHEIWLRSIERVRGPLEGERADLRGADLRGADLSGRDLRGADLSGAQLDGALLRGTNLEHAKLTGASMRDADLTGAKLEGADLTNVTR